ncbi:MAG TPA: hypothetical protein VGV14_04265, partial [Rhodanobacter sp.]|nr:hypothetical protein [Rhodanobacter sp.]
MHKLFAILGLALSTLALGAYSSTTKAQTTDVSNGSFVFLSSAKSCPYAGAPTCYLDDPVGAAAVVTALKQAGGYFFLLPSATSAQMSVMGSAISAQGGKFLTYEEWAWKAASTSGQFNCDQYTNSRIIPDLLPLKAAYPDTFYGFQLVDE